MTRIDDAAMSAIDWKVELRRISRQFDGLPPDIHAPRPAPRPAAAAPGAIAPPRHAPKPQPPRSAPRFRGPRFQAPRVRITMREDTLVRIASGARIALTAALLAALYWWPYAAQCGFGLAGLLTAELMVIAGGVSAALYTWQHRQGIGHLMALALVAAGLVLLSAQVLPRTGYAMIKGVEASTWMCTR